MTQIIYGLLGVIDMIVYSLASSLFGLIVDLANVEFFNSRQISDVTSRIYIVVGVLMLFKLVLSAIQYLVNPDVFDDKEKGMGGLLKKTAISIVLIVLVPSIFNFLIAIQEPIIKTLPDIILGPGTTDATDQRTIGFNLSFKVLSAFVRVNSDSTTSLPANVGVGEGKEIHDFASLPLHVADGCPGISLFGMGGNMEDCHYDYMVIISTLCGGFLCYVLLSLTLDVSIRTIKFGIIQMLAPIPISSYVFSKDKLNKFIKTATTVYLDLFVRMIIIYFIIFVIKTVIVENKAIEILNGSGSGMANTGDWFRNVLANIAIIFGLLMFAKNAPKFISELLGLPDVGAGDMADMFKPAWQRVGGFSSPAAAIGAYRNAKEYGESTGRALRRAFTAGGHAGVSRLRDIAAGKGLSESYKTSREAAMGRTNRNLEYANRFPNRRERRQQIRQERWDKYTGVTTGGKRASAQIEAANRALKARSNAWSRAQSKVVENASAYNGGTITDSAGNTLSYADMYALFEKDAPEMYAGQKRELASSYQKMKDDASVDFLFKSFSGVATGSGDGQSRNVFAEDVFSIARSGADKETVGKLLFKDVTVSSGATVHVDAIKAAERINTMNQLRDAGVPLTDPRWNGLQFSTDEAEALAMFARDLNKTAGTVRLEATKTQTTVPKDS